MTLNSPYYRYGLSINPNYRLFHTITIFDCQLPVNHSMELLLSFNSIFDFIIPTDMDRKSPVITICDRYFPVPDSIEP